MNFSDLKRKTLIQPLLHFTYKKKKHEFNYIYHHHNKSKNLHLFLLFLITFLNNMSCARKENEQRECIIKIFQNVQGTSFTLQSSGF